MTKSPKKRAGKARGDMDAARAKMKEIRALGAIKSTTGEEGKWEKAAKKARQKLGTSFEQPTRSTQKNWKLGKGPSSR